MHVVYVCPSNQAELTSMLNKLFSFLKYTRIRIVVFHIVVAYVITVQPLNFWLHATIFPKTYNKPGRKGQIHWLLLTISYIIFAFIVGNLIPFFSDLQSLIGYETRRYSVFNFLYMFLFPLFMPVTYTIFFLSYPSLFYFCIILFLYCLWTINNVVDWCGLNLYMYIYYTLYCTLPIIQCPFGSTHRFRLAVVVLSINKSEYTRVVEGSIFPHGSDQFVPNAVDAMLYHTLIRCIRNVGWYRGNYCRCCRYGHTVFLLWKLSYVSWGLARPIRTCRYNIECNGCSTLKKYQNVMFKKRTKNNNYNENRKYK